ncbi:MAG: hypothetical protein ACYCX2_04855 [Christensenellales bacterium]
MNELEKANKGIDWTLWGTLIVLSLGYVMLHTLLGGTLFAHSHWDSYTLQALAWRNGKLGLGQNYSYLELAVYKGDWFVSFPPVPSLVMLPLTFLFGVNTPNNLVAALYALASIAVAYKCLRHAGVQDGWAMVYAVFAVWGSNMLWMSTNGGVWFQAQGLNMLLCLGAVLCALKNRRNWSFLLLALAVGCRPFSVLYFPVLMVYYYCKDKETNPGEKWYRTLLRQWKGLIAPVLIALAYFAFNYMRFGNPFEFGHNYLPEFTEAANGQFNPIYLGENLFNIFLRPVTLSPVGALEYPVFNGFMFYIANPFFLLWIAKFVGDLYRRRVTKQKTVINLAILGTILLLCLHKTFGGWQFGARYTVDAIPLALFYLLLSGIGKPKKWELFLAAFAVLFNLYGALAMTFLHV